MAAQDPLCEGDAGRLVHLWHECLAAPTEPCEPRVAQAPLESSARDLPRRRKSLLDKGHRDHHTTPVSEDKVLDLLVQGCGRLRRPPRRTLLLLGPLPGTLLLPRRDGAADGTERGHRSVRLPDHLCDVPLGPAGHVEPPNDAAGEGAQTRERPDDHPFSLSGVGSKEPDRKARLTQAAEEASPLHPLSAQLSVSLAQSTPLATCPSAPSPPWHWPGIPSPSSSGPGGRSGGPGGEVPKVLDCCTMGSFWTPFWYPVFIDF